ncbi:MAG TPA: radical SAM protein [Candidatus Norongarragalinales archaeon]|jgi:MoaA/NifB/PqqE/SkfB family radical SAM enzyme|nr:radical SAM protein [Candidatus Norongarragalinales archaeon]
MGLDSYARLARNFFNNGMPTYVILYVTSFCNARCKMCFYMEQILNPDKNDLTLEEIEKVSLSLDRLQQLSLTGGEPYLRKDLPDIVRTFVKNNHVNYITTPTNAFLPHLVVPSVTRMVSENPNTFFRVPLSIDAIGDKHDEIRQVKGGFKKLIETYEKLNELRKSYKNFVIDVNCAFSGLNEDDAEEVVDFVYQNMNIDNISVTYARGNIPDPAARNASIEKYSKLIHNIQNKPRRVDPRTGANMLRGMTQASWDIIEETLKEDKMVLPCVAGSRLVVIGETGDVYPCELLPKKLGNVRESNYDMKKILLGDPAEETRKFIHDTDCHCTFECAVNINVVYNPTQGWPRAAKKMLEIKTNTLLNAKPAPTGPIALPAMSAAPKANAPIPLKLVGPDGHERQASASQMKPVS